MTRSSLAALAALVACAFLVVLAWTSPVGATAAGAKDPHGKADACGSCHLAVTGGGAVRPEAETCLACHPEGDPHPSNQLPRKVHVPADWPLVDGRVTCATCHAEPACSADRDREAPFLRGGNVTRTVQFCDRCHNDGTLGRVDPHHPRREGDTDDPTCGACHSGTPAPGAAPEAARLRTAPAAACATCHEGEIHAGVAAHLGKVVPASVASSLPLAEGRTIACWTCHDVHGGTQAAGELRRRSAADAIRALALQPPTATVSVAPAASPVSATGVLHPPLLALPASDGSLCRACHGVGP